MIALRPVEAAGRRIVVVSPHLDDGVLSLGAAIASWSRAGATVELLTVLGCDPDSTAPSGGWDRRGGFTTEGEAARARRAEDRRACAVIGATPVWLPFGSVDYERHGDAEDVRRAVVPAFDDADLVLVPGSPLTHADHEWLVLTLAAGGLDAGRVALYAEQPYTRREGVDPSVPPWIASALGGAVGVRAGPDAAAGPSRQVARNPWIQLAALPARDAEEPPAGTAPLCPRSRMGRPPPGLTSTTA